MPESETVQHKCLGLRAVISFGLSLRHLLNNELFSKIFAEPLLILTVGQIVGTKTKFSQSAGSTISMQE
jgi:hypothetical protein